MNDLTEADSSSEGRAIHAMESSRAEGKSSRAEMKSSRIQMKSSRAGRKSSRAERKTSRAERKSMAWVAVSRALLLRHLRVERAIGQRAQLRKNALVEVTLAVSLRFVRACVRGRLGQ